MKHTICATVLEHRCAYIQQGQECKMAEISLKFGSLTLESYLPEIPTQ